MVSNPIKVLIVEDSLVASELLAYIINSDPALQVMAQVDNGEKALEYLKIIRLMSSQWTSLCPK